MLAYSTCKKISPGCGLETNIFLRMALESTFDHSLLYLYTIKIN